MSAALASRYDPIAANHCALAVGDPVGPPSSAPVSSIHMGLPTDRANAIALSNDSDGVSQLFGRW